MPLTPHEALEKNRGKLHLQFDRAIEDLAVEVEQALSYYTGNPIYVGLPAYLQYKVQADNASDAGPVTLNAVDQELHAKFAQFGWKIGIVTNLTESYYWAKLVGREE
jgi:hypothetical protein